MRLAASINLFFSPATYRMLADSRSDAGRVRAPISRLPNPAAFFLLLSGAAASPTLGSTPVFERVIGPGDSVPYGTVTGAFRPSINNSGDWVLGYMAVSGSTGFADFGILSSSGWQLEPRSTISTEGGDARFIEIQSLSINNHGDIAAGVKGAIFEPSLTFTSSILVNGSEFVHLNTAQSSWDFVPGHGPIPLGGIRDMRLNDNGSIVLTSSTDLPPGVIPQGPNLVSRIDPNTASPTGWSDQVLSARFMPVQGAPVDGEAFVLGFYNSSYQVNMSSAGQAVTFAEVQADYNGNGFPDQTRPMFLVDDTVIAYQGMAVPGNPSLSFAFAGNVNSTGDVNQSGKWALSTQILDPEYGIGQAVLTSDGEVLAQFGKTYDWAGDRYLWPSTAIDVLDSGDVVWTSLLSDEPASSGPLGLFINQNLLIEAGVTKIDGKIVDNFASIGSNGYDFSENGEWLIINLVFDDQSTGTYRMHIPSPATIAPIFLFAFRSSLRRRAAVPRLMIRS